MIGIFSPTTVKGYRSAISTTLKQISKEDFSNQSILSDVVRSFELERPRTKTHFPKWDLALVLSTLSGERFEPLQSCGFKELTSRPFFSLHWPLVAGAVRYMRFLQLTFNFQMSQSVYVLFLVFLLRTSCPR